MKAVICLIASATVALADVSPYVSLQEEMKQAIARGNAWLASAQPAALAAPSIGFALVAAVLIGGGITGGAVNPDRALAQPSCPAPATPCGSISWPTSSVASSRPCSVSTSSAKPLAPTVDTANSDGTTEESNRSEGNEDTGAGNQNVKSATH